MPITELHTTYTVHGELVESTSRQKAAYKPYDAIFYALGGVTPLA